MNWLSAITTAIFTGAGAAIQTGTLGPKYAGYALIAAAIIQGFQKGITQKNSDASLPTQDQASTAAAGAGSIAKPP